MVLEVTPPWNKDSNAAHTNMWTQMTMSGEAGTNPSLQGSYSMCTFTSRRGNTRQSLSGQYRYHQSVSMCTQRNKHVVWGVMWTAVPAVALTCLYGTILGLWWAVAAVCYITGHFQEKHIYISQNRTWLKSANIGRVCCLCKLGVYSDLLHAADWYVVCYTMLTGMLV